MTLASDYIAQLLPHWYSLFLPEDKTHATIYFSTIVDAYCEPHRHYHTLQHLVECMDDIHDAANESRDVVAVLFFHDLVYNPKAAPGDNERQSGLRFVEFVNQKYQLAWWKLPPNEQKIPDRRRSPEIARHCALLLDWIRFTQHNLKPSDRGGSWDLSFILDIDLAILGKPPERFWQYEDQIRKEYFFVPDEIYRPARAHVLQSFMARPRIYETTPMLLKYEKQARINIAESLKKLAG